MGSFIYSVIGIFHGHKPSGHTLELVSTKPLTEVSSRNISRGKRQPVHRAGKLTTFMCSLS